MPKNKLHYGIADRAWQPLIGCEPSMPCAKRCWARNSVARTVECLQGDNPKRAKFYQIALTPDRQEWSGKTVIDEEHIADPLSWTKSSIVATGFHGDIGRLPADEIRRIFKYIALSPRHDFMLLTKVPGLLADVLEPQWWVRLGNSPSQGGYVYAPAVPGAPASANVFKALPNVTIGCSVMYQKGEYGADQMREPMARLSAMGWRTHVWFEPALQEVDWRGWEHLELMIVGGESEPGGAAARPFEIRWAESALKFCRKNDVAFRMKQLGRYPLMDGLPLLQITTRKGDDPAKWPEHLRVQEISEAMKRVRKES